MVDKCNSFIETSLKFLGSAQGEGIPQSDANNLATVLLACQQFLEDKYSHLLVKGKHSKDVATMFELLNAGKSGLSERHRSNLTLAVQTAPPQLPTPQTSQTSRQGSRNRYFHNNKQDKRSSDTYNNIANRSVPSNRPNNDSN